MPIAPGALAGRCCGGHRPGGPTTAADPADVLRPVKLTQLRLPTDPAAGGELLLALDSDGQPPTALAPVTLRFLAPRPPESCGRRNGPSLRSAHAEWRFPRTVMKMAEQHSPCCSALQKSRAGGISRWPELARAGRFAQPCGGWGTPATATDADDDFASMAARSTSRFPPDVIKSCAGALRTNKVRAAYNKAQRLPERRKMMQAWADYLTRPRRTWARIATSSQRRLS